VQRLLEPIFREEKDIEVIGRYMLAAPTQGWARSRKGLIDASLVDPRAIAAILHNHNIALIEDICTTDIPSVTRFDEQGRPVLSENVISSKQHDRLAPIQEYCVQFARDAEAFFAKVARTPPVEALRKAALGALTRMLFFTSEAEIDCLEGFRIDLNLGTDDSFRLFDREQGLVGLQRRGLFSLDSSQENMRTNYPVELRSASLTLSLTLLAAGRYSLDFNHNDLTFRRESLKVLFIRGDQSTSKQIDAVASTQVIRTDRLFKDNESVYARDISANTKYDGMVERGPGIFECTSPTAFMMPTPPKLSEMPAAMREGEARSMVCRIVFRPLARRPA
jgi:hypothetical protein